MIKINVKYNLKKIKEEVNILLDKHQLVNNQQLLLQSIEGNDWYSIKAPYKIRNDLRENDYMKPNTPGDWEITKLIKDTGICRTRLMKLKPKECYSWHHDVGDRLHLAVWTSEKCFFIEDKKLVNIPADGHPYIVNVDNYHTAMNCSENDRYHIVGVFREQL